MNDRILVEVCTLVIVGLILIALYAIRIRWGVGAQAAITGIVGLTCGPIGYAAGARRSN